MEEVCSEGRALPCRAAGGDGGAAAQACSLFAEVKQTIAAQRQLHNPAAASQPVHQPSQLTSQHTDLLFAQVSR